MFRHELSTFLQSVLDAVERLPDGVLVDASFEPDPRHLATISSQIGARPEEVREALMGLQASHCLVQQPLDIPGIEPVYLWTVHPQCACADERC